MKGFFMRKLILILLVTFTLFLVSCESSPAMGELLDYQNEDFSMTLRITDGDIFSGALTRQGGALSLMLTGKDETEGIVFTQNDGALTLSHGETALPLPEGALSKARAWLALFALSPDGLWKIKKETLGGIAVFICTESDSGVTLYLDAATHLPLKITAQDGLSVDILSVSR